MTTTPDKSHIGKRVKFMFEENEKVGTLINVRPYHHASHGSIITILEPNETMYFVASYELINEPMTLETLVPGTLLKRTGSDYYRQVLAPIGGEGEMKVYQMSDWNPDKTHNDLKRADVAMTVFQLREIGYTIVDDSEEVVVTMEEIAKLKGVKVSQIRVKE